MTERDLLSATNLELAFRRVTAGHNLQYKRYFRHLYRPYELGLPENLRLLRTRLQGDWQPNSPYRVYLPKPSGLLRPLTLLAVEDQILLQALANVFARKLRTRRRNVQGQSVFSNCLQDDPNSIFFLDDWRLTYNAFKQKIRAHLNCGYRWIAHFDLAAFYDTISHEGLIRVAAPRSYNSQTWDQVRKWLGGWMSYPNGLALRHGIPQGPIASDFLAECYLLPLDEKMMQGSVRYVRYVDDIRMMARTEKDAYAGAVELELACRELGLIPQSAKFKVERVRTLREALGTLPSIVDQGRRNETAPRMSRAEAEAAFRGAIAGRPLRIVDKSRARYALYRAPASPKLLGWVLSLIGRQPEHIDAFAAFLDNYVASTRIESLLAGLVESQPVNDYFRGELWRLLARFAGEQTLASLRMTAKAEFTKGKCTIVPSWGAGKFLIRGQQAGLPRINRSLSTANPLLKSLLVGDLPDCEFEKGRLAARILRSGELEPTLALIEPMLGRNLNLRSLGVLPAQLPPQVANSLKALGIVRTTRHRIDVVSCLLVKRFGVSAWTNWKSLLRAEYLHGHSLLRHADALYDSHRSDWLQWMNAFNDVVVRRLLPVLNANRLLGQVTLVNARGELVDLGAVLQAGAPFDRDYPDLARFFREFNDRRNKIPGSHPYAKRTLARNKFLSAGEQRDFAQRTRTAYEEIITLLRPLL